MTAPGTAPKNVHSQIAAALRKDTPRAAQFAVQIESLSEDASTARVRLCTGGTLDVPTSLARTLVPMGLVESGDERHVLALAEVDVSTDAGKALRETARELTRMSRRLRLAEDQIRRAGTPGTSLHSERSDLLEATVPLTPFDFNLPVVDIKLSFLATAGDGHLLDYNAPSGQYFRFFQVLELGNCYFTSAPYYDVFVRAKPVGIQFYLEAAHGTPIGQRYFGTMLVRVALVEFTT